MAMQNALLLKVGGGLVAVGGTGVAGYVYRDALSDFWNSDNRVFLVQASEVKENTENINEEKNYCSLKNEKDKDCELFSFNFNKEKYVESSTIINSHTLAKKITNNSFYKLIVNRWKIKTLVEKSDETIEIKDGTTILAKMKIISTMYESTEDKPVDEWKGNKLLVRADKSVLESSDMNLSDNKCKFVISTTDTSDIKCDVYKFNNEPSGKHTLDFSKIKKLTKFNEIQAGQYYIVDFDLTENDTTAKSKITDENIKKIFIKKESTTNVALTFQSKIITNLKEVTSDLTKTEGLLLNKNFVKEAGNSTYLITKSESASNSGFSSHKNNYKCELSGKTDENCVIIELTDKEKTLLNITNADNVPTTINTENKYYKVIANNEIISAITSWGTGSTSIVIKSKNTSDSSNEYGKLKPFFSIENGKIIKGKTKFVIATAKEVITKQTAITTSTQFQCKVDDAASATNCDVYKFSDKLFNAINDVDKLTTTLTKATDNNDWEQGKVFLIDLKTPEIDHSKTTATKNVGVKVKVNGGSSDITTLSINAHLFDKTTFDGSNFSNLLILV